jgi:hypothetical protein
MRRFIVASVIASSIITTGCTANWLQVVTNVAVAVTRIEQQVQNALSIASTIFNIVIQLVPTAQQSTIITNYNTAVSAVVHAEASLDAAVAAAKAATNSNPDFSAIYADIGTALDQLTAVITQLQSFQSANMKSPNVTMSNLFADYKDEVTAIKAYR